MLLGYFYSLSDPLERNRRGIINWKLEVELEQLGAVSVQYHPLRLSERGIDLNADFVSHSPTKQPRVLMILGGTSLTCRHTWQTDQQSKRHAPSRRRSDGRAEVICPKRSTKKETNGKCRIRISTYRTTEKTKMKDKSQAEWRVLMPVHEEGGECIRLTLWPRWWTPCILTLPV